MSAPAPDPATRLDWTKRYREARRIAHLIAKGADTAAERDMFSSWLAGHMRAYLETCVSQGWDWTAESESDRDEMTEWVRDDLDLDTIEGLSLHRATNLAESMCVLAGWPDPGSDS